MNHSGLENHKGHHVILASVVPFEGTSTQISQKRVGPGKYEGTFEDRFDANMTAEWFCLDCGSADAEAGDAE